MQQTARVAAETHKQAAEVILRDFYMDDLLTGAASSAMLARLQKDISFVLSCGGFELRKWASNDKQLFENVPNASNRVSHLLAADEVVRTLGLIWNTEGDFLTFAVQFKPPPLVISKREFLSDASLLFDPLGLLAPCTILPKIWFQQLWRENIGWDEAVPSNIAHSWSIHRNDLLKLASLNVNRWIGTGGEASVTELHVFADASERAYAAAVYARTICQEGVTVRLVAAKAKVAPLKTTTLPRLELCAAHLAAKLAEQVSASLDKASIKFFAWTDSTVTLAWLQGHPSRWSTFVANRVAAVQETLPPECWSHVRSECNPADCASRGVSATFHLQNQLWWNGPLFLREVATTWEHNTNILMLTKLEQRTSKLLSCVSNQSAQWEILNRYSSFIRLKRLTAYLLRFINNLRAARTNEKKLIGPITYEELRKAEILLIKANQPVPLKSCLVRLQPFLDENGLLRVGGRIKHSIFSVDVKHPIVLPRNSTIAKLIINDIHTWTLHAGLQIMQTTLQRRFWVLGSRNLVRKIYRSCVKCQRCNRTPLQQSMSNLPISRTIYVRCFLRSAVDFAGPYPYKFAAGRGNKSTKGYISSFICMATGAMHLEFVSDLSSSGFLNAFRRFINRRGYCQHMHSDNGTNFVGAERELRAAFQQCMADDTVKTYFANSAITWHFNPPHAPHMGGYWETGIKRVKYHLRRALGETLLSFEEFATLLSEIEACVNSRPLCVNASDVSDKEVLTPGHFIIGEPLKAIPELEQESFKGNLYKRWHLISTMRHHFWQRWRDDYLVNLQQRTKWFRPTTNLQEGDVVAIAGERSPPTKWKIARVLKCHPGSDGCVRVVSLKTADGECVRPIHKICRLPTKGDIFSEDAAA